MESAISRGFPFELEDVWRRSTFQQDEHDGLAFQQFATDWPALELDGPEHIFKESFEIPGLGQANDFSHLPLDDVESEGTSSTGDAPTTGDACADPATDVWTLELTLNGVQEPPRLRTWEAFDRKDVPSVERLCYVSEAGPNVFDATAQRLESRPTDAGVLPQDVLLRALCNLSLGRSSLFFNWDEEKRSFVRSLVEVPISGFSMASTDSFTRLMLRHGTRFRFLEEYSRSRSSYKRTCTAITALKGYTTEVLNAVEEHTANRLVQLRSMIQLQDVIGRSHQLIETLETLVTSVDGLSTDEDVISAVSIQVNEIVATQSCVAKTLQILLARISSPWLERLCADLGLSDDRSYGGDVEPVLTNSQNSEHHEDSFVADDTGVDALPDFVDRDDKVLIVECKRSLKALRQHLPVYELSLPLSTALSELHLGRMDQDSPTAADTSIPPEKSTNLAWSDAEEQRDYLRTLDNRMSEPLIAFQQQSDRCHQGLDRVMNEYNEEAPPGDLLGGLGSNPIERLRPVIRSHARYVDNIVLRHLFYTCRLRHHLDLQRQYHLFGNGDFVARLKTALFSSETQTAQRNGGTIPTGQTMGLRLSSRDEQRWPPASSELRLTLAGVLTETYHEDFAATGTMRVGAKELPGGLSFSIRELPDAEIERVLDSNSIYALDFLRLQYRAPPALEAVITPSCLQAYDAVFRHVLRLIRVLDVTTQLIQRLKSSASGSNADRLIATRSATEVHHFISILISHIMDIGVEAPWSLFMHRVDEVKKQLGSEENDDVINNGQATAGLEELRRHHEQCLESIGTRCFLQRKQEKVRSNIEYILSATLKCAASIEQNDPSAFSTLHNEFQQNVKELMKLLRATLSKSGRGKPHMGTAENDAENVSLLLARLDCNGFYDNGP